MSELVIQSGKLQGKRLVLPSKQMVVGRDDDCDLRIGSALVSRKHCVLKNTPEGILVTDLGSQNGTLVNDAPIKGPTLLREGDVLRIG
ncbi:FHA domain-containing protein, partial [Schlesneria sp.]